MYYDYRLRLQVASGTLQEGTLRFLKQLSESPHFGEKQRAILALCCYWSVEALTNQSASKESVQDLAEKSILEMAYQMQQIADLAGIDLEDVDIPAPVTHLVKGSHSGVRGTFVDALACSQGSVRVPKPRPRSQGKPKTAKPETPAPDLPEPLEVPKVKSSPKGSNGSSSKNVAKGGKGGGYNIDLFG